MVVGALGKRVSRKRDCGFEPRPLRLRLAEARLWRDEIRLDEQKRDSLRRSLG